MKLLMKKFLYLASLFFPDQLRLVCACEAVIAFSLYGTAEWRQNKAMFPKEIRDSLGLSKKHFKHNQCRIQPHEICVGTKGLLNFKVEGHNVTCTAKFPIYELKTYLSEDTRKKLRECIGKIGLDRTNHPVLREMSIILLETIIEFSKIENKVCRNSSWNTLRDSGLTTCTIIPVTPDEFSEYLFTNNSVYYNKVLAIVYQYKFALQSDLFKNFHKLFASTLEEQILQKECMLIVPAVECSNFAIIPLLPFRTHSLNDLTTSSLIDDLKSLCDKMISNASDKLKFSTLVHRALQTNASWTNLDEFLELVIKQL